MEQKDNMDFNGEIVFDIADVKRIEVDFGTDILPTKVINKGEEVALGRKAPKYRWMYEVKYDSEREYLENLEKIISQLCERSEYINQLTKIYEEVSISIYIRSDFAEIGFSLPSIILKKMSLLDCTLNFEILSFGMAIDEELSRN
ncbi:MAG: DUF4279 domain-containing protein [Lachnospiraceae bacterium]|nr:DUF4279 domain-containing protein [Lachnospiraceae bacterium]